MKTPIQKRQHSSSPQALRGRRALLFDWGDTLMRNFPDFPGPMVSWPQVEAIPGTHETLERLNPCWTIALATNAADSDEVDIWAALERCELARWVDKVYCYKKVGHMKPSQAFFEYIVTDLQLKPARMVMVGDDFQADVLGAVQCGLKAVWFNPGASPNQEGTGFTTIQAFTGLEAALSHLKFHGPV